MTPKTYLCQNPACSLGAVGEAGRFTSGATKAQITVMTGDPDPDEFGHGVCPNCGKPATTEEKN